MVSSSQAGAEFAQKLATKKGVTFIYRDQVIFNFKTKKKKAINTIPNLKLLNVSVITFARAVSLPFPK